MPPDRLLGIIFWSVIELAFRRGGEMECKDSRISDCEAIVIDGEVAVGDIGEVQRIFHCRGTSS